MKAQAFGSEIELTGITKEQAAHTIATYFGTRSQYEGGAYGKNTVTDSQGRKWQVVKDASIKAKQKVNGAYTGQ